MGNSLFGKPKAVAVVNKPTLSIREQIVILEKRKAHLELLAAHACVAAKESKTKEGAIRHLKAKQLYTKEINTIYGMLEKLETLENARQRMMITKDVLDVTDHANRVIKNNMMEVDKVEDFMDQMAETISQADEISQVVGAPLTTSFDIEQEYEDLVEEKNKIPVMPEIPTTLPQRPVDPLADLRMLVPS